MRRATPIPTFCGNRTLSPHVGSRPTRAWVSANRACSDAIRMSQYSVSSSPPVTAAPLIAPITGLVNGGQRGEMSGSADCPPSSLRSSPAQNTGSVPVRMTTSTASSVSASARAVKNWSRSAADNALRDCGRFRVRVRTRSSVWINRMSSVISATVVSPTCRASTGLSLRNVPKHHRIARPRACGDERGDRRGGAAVCAQGQRHHPPVLGQCRGLRSRGGRSRGDDGTAVRCTAATPPAAEDLPAVASAGDEMTQTTTALKEWSAVVHALLDGRQSVLLRKGGIGEKRFEVAAREFMLFPTVAHSHAERVRPEFRDFLTAAAAASADDRVVLRAAAKVVAALAVNRPDNIEAIEDLHIRSAQSGREVRLDFRPKHRLAVLVVQAIPLVEPVELARTPDYAGCTSWVELPVVTPKLGTPVHDDAALRRVAARVRDAVG